jgi:hypothetical protein
VHPVRAHIQSVSEYPYFKVSMVYGFDAFVICANICCQTRGDERGECSTGMSTSQRLSFLAGELSCFSVRLLILKPLGEDFFVDDASLVTDCEVCKRLLSFSSYIYIID